jgi:hypothetical protein
MTIDAVPENISKIWDKDYVKHLKMLIYILQCTGSIFQWVVSNGFQDPRV